MKLDSSRSLFVRLLILAFLALVPPAALVVWQALDGFEQGLVPEMDKKAEAVGRDLAASIERAVGYGIPVDRLVGVGEFFAPVLDGNREIRYLALTDHDGRILFLLGADSEKLQPHYASADFENGGEYGRKATIDDYIDRALPVMVKGQRIGQLHVGIEASYVRGRLNDIASDIGIVVLVSLLVAFELLLFVVTFNVTGPMRLIGTVVDKVRRGDFTTVAGVVSGDEVGRFVGTFNSAIRRTDELYRRLGAYVEEVKAAHFDKTVIERVSEIEARVGFLFRFARAGEPGVVNEDQATDIRLPLFLFVFAEEISRSFMPLFVRDIYAPIPGLDPRMVIALPIAAFMAFIAMASPWAALMTSRLGSRRVFLIGLVPATLGLLMSAMALSLYDFIIWRAATAVGYAMVTMACQGYISQALQSQRRAQGLGVYVGAVLTASVCGTGIGGVLAESMGYRATFVVAAVLATLSGTLMYRLMRGGRHGKDLREPRMREFAGLLRNWRFTALVVFAAVPSKMALTGFFFFLVPLALFDQEGAQLADIARTMILYPIAVVLLSPLASRLSDRLGWKAGLVAVGGLIGGAALVAPAMLPGAQPVALGVLLLGLSHGLSASPQLAMIPDVCWTECRSMGQANVLAFLRFAERGGSVVGPLLAAAFIPVYGYGGAIMALGVVVLAMSAVFALLSLAYRAGPNIQAEVA
ncbi:MAG: MFS transporter [Magnetospirillum sp.]|nr:MFS transporter [Magnetospirillum sp.]